MANAVGPAFTGGFESFVINDESNEQYTILYLPDRNNEELQRERKSPVFYYLPEQVRLARQGDTKDFKFRHTHFVGVFDENSIGVDRGETQGGVLAFTITSRFPTQVLRQSQEQLLQKFRGDNDKYWGIRTNVAPEFRIAPILSNVTAISNITPNGDGSTPGMGGAAGGGAAGGGAAGGGGAAEGGAAGGGAAGGGVPAAGGGQPGGETPDGGPRGFDANGLARSVPHGRGFRAPSALDPWAWRMEGQGPGSITGGENAFAAILGPIPSEIIWAGFHGAYSPIVAIQNLRMPMWSQLMRVKITGKWKRIFEHFSAAAQARYLWFSADVKAEFNRMRMNGDIKVEVDIDGTMPGGDRMEQVINARIDTIVAQFNEIAKKVIFDPPQPNVEPAQAPSGGLFSSLFSGGAGVALKARRDETQVDLNYEETRYFRYVQPHTISSSLQGFYNEIKNDPRAEQKYFTRLVLGGLGRKVTRFIKPVVNWPDRTRNHVGEPVAFLSAQVGYPGEQGQIQWSSQTFQSADPIDTTFRPVFVERRREEVRNPPPGWTPDKTFLKRRVHFMEAPGENAYPFTKVFVEKNVVELDPGANGTLTNDNIIEVRADEVGTLDVGPVSLGAELSASSEMVEVEFRTKGTRADGTDRFAKATRFLWKFEDQNEPRYYRIFTGQLDFKPDYQYRVHVTVKGTLFNKGKAWTGPWQDVNGNGSLMVAVPGPDDTGVTTRQLTTREMASTDMVRAVDPAMVSVVVTTDVGEPQEAPGAEPAEAPAGEPVVAGAPGEGAPRSADDSPRETTPAEEAPREPETVGAGASSGKLQARELLPMVSGYGVTPSESRSFAGAGVGSGVASTRPRSVGLEYATGRATDEAPRDMDAGGWREVPAASSGESSAPRTDAPAAGSQEDGWYELPATGR